MRNHLLDDDATNLMVAHGIYQCGEPDCTVCQLEPAPGEDRATWLARLTALCATLPADGRGQIPMVPCPTCGGEKRRGSYPCGNCSGRRRRTEQAHAIAAVIRPCGRCGEPCDFGLICSACRPVRCTRCGTPKTRNGACQECRRNQLTRGRSLGESA